MKLNSKIKLLLAIVIGCLFSCNNGSDDTLTIAAASNTQFVIKELIADFEKRKEIECTFVTGSSGKLTTQIVEGAPFDLFLSADMKYPKFLFDKKKAQEPKIFAKGELVLWTTNPDIQLELKRLTARKEHLIALANPKIAPYGKAAIDYLKEKGIYNEIRGQLVYGENISQTSQFVLSQSADFGFVSKSIVLAPSVKGKGTWIDIECKSCSPIYQGVAVLKNRKNHIVEAEIFMDYLLGEEARDILNKYGYSTNFDFKDSK